MTAQVFRLPDLGEGLTEAELVRWLVAVGDTSPSTSRSPRSRPPSASSRCRRRSPAPSPCCTARRARCSSSAPRSSRWRDSDGGRRAVGFAAVEEAEAYRAEEQAGSGNVLVGFGTRRRTRAAARAVRASRPVVDTPAPRLAPAVMTTGPVAVRSPIVRRLAHDRGVDLHTVTPHRSGWDRHSRATVDPRGTAPVAAARRPVARGREPLEHAAPHGRRQDVAQPRRDPRGDGLGGCRRDRALDPASRRWPTPRRRPPRRR